MTIIPLVCLTSVDQRVISSQNSIMSSTPALSLSVLQEVQLRFLGPGDVAEVKKLCREWFPIEYPDSWYEEITSNSRFYSLAATHHARIIGIVVAELKAQSKLNKEDGDLLASYYPPTAQVAYILSLGVVDGFRRNGIASLLLDSLLSYLTSKERSDCKAVYLHVLSTNTVALRFYERRSFQRHLFLPYYYAIQGKARDGYSYVLYMNGGQPPWSLLNIMGHCAGKNQLFVVEKVGSYGVVISPPLQQLFDQAAALCTTQTCLLCSEEYLTASVVPFNFRDDSS